MTPLFICRTSGDGHWTRKVCDVPVLELKIAYLNKGNLLDSTFGELRVYFDTNVWNTHRDNVIYTDTLFLEQLEAHLQSRGFSAAATAAIDYSEQGMQGRDYVSFDIGEAFIRECDPFVNFLTDQAKAIDIQLA